jgi:hypothetical protein
LSSPQSNAVLVHAGELLIPNASKKIFFGDAESGDKAMVSLTVYTHRGFSSMSITSDMDISCPIGITFSRWELTIRHVSGHVILLF